MIAELVVSSIHALGIEHPPFRELRANPNGGIFGGEVDAWKDWWNEVKEGRRTYRFMGSSIEYGSDGPASKELIQLVKCDRKRDDERAAGHRKSSTSPVFSTASLAGAALGADAAGTGADDFIRAAVRANDAHVGGAESAFDATLAGVEIELLDRAVERGLFHLGDFWQWQLALAVVGGSSFAIALDELAAHPAKDVVGDAEGGVVLLDVAEDGGFIEASD